MSAAGHLLVRAGGRLVGLPLDQVIEVLDPGDDLPGPGAASRPSAASPSCGAGSCRWCTWARCSTAAPVRAERTDTGVLVELAGRRLCLEVEDAESVLYDAGPAGAAGRGAAVGGGGGPHRRAGSSRCSTSPRWARASRRPAAA